MLEMVFTVSKSCFKRLKLFSCEPLHPEAATLRATGVGTTKIWSLIAKPSTSKIHLPPFINKLAAMEKDNWKDHVDFMTDAAHLLQAAAPETSAYLLSRRNELIFQSKGQLTPVQMQHDCNGCGNILIPGQGRTTLKLESMRKHHRRQRKHGTEKKNHGKGQSKNKVDLGKSELQSGPVKILTCGYCDSVTKSFAKTVPAPRRKAVKTAALAVTVKVPKLPVAAGDGANKRAENSNSKQRAKARKAGLQALLSKNESTAKSQAPRSLTLADFMKK
jgi:hypothetical protein